MLTMLLLCVSGADLVGECSRVVDGDTVKVICHGREVTVRLEGLDAPEKRQDYGSESTRALEAMVLHKIVRIEVLGKDKHFRTLGVIYADGIDVQREMIRRGHAWHYWYYNSDNTLAYAEDEARKEGAGLWGLDGPVEPWEWRARKRERK